MKKRVGILCGGVSAEHEISLCSAENVFSAMDKDLYLPTIVGIAKDGRWYRHEGLDAFENRGSADQIRLSTNGTPVFPIPWPGEDGAATLRSFERLDQSWEIDVFFSVLHGPLGEDGGMQGLFALMNIPYVGPGILSSALCMDKAAAKDVCRAHGIPVAPYMVFSNATQARDARDEVIDRLGLPIFVKPANMGSSVGISKVTDADKYSEAIELAFLYDLRVVVEQNISGREIEVAVMGDEAPQASRPGEVRPTALHGFYSYAAKYLDEKGAELIAPADLSPGLEERVRQFAVRAYQCLGCEGLSRVDLFVAESGEILLNEINTLPGFTKISMFPTLWGKTGIAYQELISQLITYACDRHARRAVLHSDREGGI